MRRAFNAGDNVHVLRVPGDVLNSFTEETKAAFRLAVGKAFDVRAVNEIGWLEIDLGDEAGSALGTIGNTIRIEPECVDLAGKRGVLGSEFVEGGD